MARTYTLWSATVTTAPEMADAVAQALADDSCALTMMAPPRTRSAHIEALYDFAPDRAALTARVAVATAMHRVKMPRIDIREIPKLDWLKKVAGDFPPLPIAHWIVHGAQHRHAVLRRRLVLQIDATSAFGTGEHPTTRGCLEMLDRILKYPHPHCGRGRGPSRSDGRVRALDLGCGSGILAMAWAQATRGRAVAVDLDPESVAVARENVRINGLQRNIRVGLSHGYRAPPVRQNAPYDLVMANIFAGPLRRMAKDLKRHLRPGGIAILSGLLNRQANAVLAAHRMQGLFLIRRLVIGEWSVLALQRPERAK